MAVITTRLIVAPDGTVSIATPLPAGEHQATVTIADASPRHPEKPSAMKDFPIDDGPWDDNISLRREDMYGDDRR